MSGEAASGVGAWGQQAGAGASGRAARRWIAARPLCLDVCRLSLPIYIGFLIQIREVFSAYTSQTYLPGANAATQHVEKK
jgi:hypothetical protein